MAGLAWAALAAGGVQAQEADADAGPPGTSGQLIEANGVRMRFVCGFGDAGANVDYRARQAMLLLIGHYYEHREEVIVERGVNIQRLPMAAGMLCNDLRMKVKRF